jgi:hypothetical protein
MLNRFIFIYLLLILMLPTVNSKLVYSYGSSILFLRTLAITFSSNFYYSTLFSSVKSTEMGFINYSINSQVAKPLRSLTATLFSSLFKVQFTSLYIISFLALMINFSFVFYAE